MPAHSIGKSDQQAAGSLASRRLPSCDGEAVLLAAPVADYCIARGFEVADAEFQGRLAGHCPSSRTTLKPVISFRCATGSTSRADSLVSFSPANHEPPRAIREPHPPR
jgi:hypothetical protein